MEIESEEQDVTFEMSEDQRAFLETILSTSASSEIRKQSWNLTTIPRFNHYSP